MPLQWQYFEIERTRVGGGVNPLLSREGSAQSVDGGRGERRTRVAKLRGTSEGRLTENSGAPTRNRATRARNEGRRIAERFARQSRLGASTTRSTTAAEGRSDAEATRLFLMICRDYTEELGLAPAKKLVPLPIAIAIFIVAGAGIWFAVAKLNLLPSGEQPRQEAAAVPAAPAQ